MQESEFVTQEKKESLERELEFLKTEKRSGILERLAFAKSLGDLSENAEYHSAKEEQGKNEARISQIEVVLKNAVIVEVSDDGKIGLGSTVVLEKQDTQEEKVYQIVGNEEADFSIGKISFESPLGAALMNKRSKEMVTISTPKGDTLYLIKEVK